MAALTIPNRVKEDAKKHRLAGWKDMPDEIELWRIEDDQLVIPRGFAHNLVEGLEADGHAIIWNDKRAWKTGFRVGNKIAYRPHQIPAVEATIDNEQGIYKAPAGSGKTVTMLGVARRLACKTIVIVNTKDILDQWQKRAATFLGEHFPVSQIGDGKLDDSGRIVVATAQTLHSRFDELEAAGFFDQFGMMVLDECHHATADTYWRVVDRFSARYRIGVSATPDKTGDFELAKNVLGPIYYVTSPKELQGLGILMLPEIIAVSTGFKYSSTQKRGSKTRGNDYNKVLAKLLLDPERNEGIVRAVMREGTEQHGLLLTKRLDHIELLISMLEDEGFGARLMTLTGTDKTQHRKEVIEFLSNEPGVMLSTLADEALDIPRLDRGYLTFPQNNTGLITQQVGRFEREHPDKKDARIYDFVDRYIGEMKNQYNNRKYKVYLPRGYTITRMKIGDL